MSSQPSDFKLDAPPEFSAKIASIFAQFDDIEKKRNESLRSREQGSPSMQKDDPAVLRDDEFAIPKSKLQLDRRNSFSPCASEASRRRPPPEFKRPKVPPLPKNKIPDHKLHPQNWTKYSLASVEESQMSDGANTAAALAYLKQQERRSQGQALWDEDAQLLDLRAKVMFRGRERSSERLRPKFLTGGLPEVSVSQTASRNIQPSEAGENPTRPNFGTKVRTLVENRAIENRKIALSHLQEIDDEDGDHHDDDDDDAMKVDENIQRPQSKPSSEEGSSNSHREEQPRSKRFKRAVRSRSDAGEDDDEIVATGDNKP